MDETPFEIARREAFEEIGLPQDDKKIPAPFRIEHLCQLPYSLAKTELAVRPCVAFLHSDDITGKNVGDSMIPRLDAKEVAAVFSAPFHNFLKSEDEVREGETIPGETTDWYQGSWTAWHEDRWRMHRFYVPIDNQIVTKPKVRDGGQRAIAESLDEEEEAGMKRYLVWGMTARMLVDAARTAYGEEPDFEVSGNCLSFERMRTNLRQYNTHIGDEKMIERLYEMGGMGEKKKAEAALTPGDIAKAAKM